MGFIGLAYMADSRSVSSSEDKSSLSSRGGVFGRVLHRLSFRRKSLNTDARRSFRFPRKTKSFDQSFFRRKSEIVVKKSSAQSLDLDNVDFQDRLSETSEGYFTNNKHEVLYRGMLRNLLHPLGTSDKTVGLRPGDLIDHLKEAFDIDVEDHEKLLRQEIQNKPKQLMLGVRVIEAKFTGSTHKLKDYKPYCVLHVSGVNKRRKSAASLSKLSSRSSPKNSPKLKRPPEEAMITMKTQLANSSESPNWNEEFQLEVLHLLTDELHIYVCQQEIENENKSEKKSPFRGLFSRKQTSGSNTGTVVIPLREIPVQGIDGWYNISSLDGSVKSPSIGQCHLNLSLSHIQDSKHMSMFSAEDYYQASLQFHKHCLDTTQRECKTKLCLPEKSRRILDVFGSANRISKLSQSIMDLVILLELTAGENYKLIPDKKLHQAVKEVQLTWMAKQVGNQTFTDRMPLSDAEICMYRTSTRLYIRAISDRLDELPCLFPPSVDNLTVLKSKIGIVVELLEIDLWDSCSTPQDDLTTKIAQKLKADLQAWLKAEISNITNHSLVKDEVIPECTACVQILQKLTSHCTQIGVIKEFYKSFNIKYYRVVILIAENTFMKEIRSQMMAMDKYQMRYHFYPVNINLSSKLSLQLYMAIQKFYEVAKEHLGERDLFRISYSQYQIWFQNSLVFWLQTFRTECLSRVEKALEIDKDVVLVTSLVKFSNSTVDTLSCFAKITEEWAQINYKIPDLAVMAVTKITDLICDGARVYADKIHNILERNCYYDSNEKQFDVNDRLCITLNNIEHVRKYLDELPELLNWQSVADALSVKHEDEAVGEQSLRTLNRLLTTTQCDILLKSSFLLQEIVNKMKVNIQQTMENLARQPEKPSALDGTLEYLNYNLEILNTRLMSSIYPQMLANLCHVVLNIFNEQLQIGRLPEYYQHMKTHFHSLSSFFISCGVNESMVKKRMHEKVCRRLGENSLSTQELMSIYFDNLANNVRTPEDYLGHLAVTLGYVEESHEKVSIYIKVIRGVNLPGLDPSGKSDPYVNINIRPHTLVPKLKTQRTHVVYRSLQPTFNAEFTLSDIPKACMTTMGAVLVFSVLDHDNFMSDDFAGEVVIHLAAIQKIEDNKNMDSVQATILPLKRPQQPHSGAFQILVERQVNDKVAKHFVNERMYFINNQPSRTDGGVASSKSALCGLFSFLT